MLVLHEHVKVITERPIDMNTEFKQNKCSYIVYNYRISLDIR
jgi:hypothetical protein